MELNWNNYRPLEGTTIITTLDLHTAGEPFRIITGGMPELQGSTILERRRYMHEHFDHIRRALIWEPRGHFDMYGCIVTPPVTPEADFGVIFMHNEGYSTMCGHGIIALVTALVGRAEVGEKGRQHPVILITPAGWLGPPANLDRAR